MVHTYADTRAASVVGRHARLELTFEYRAGRTVVAHAYAEPPLRIGRSFDVNGAAYIILVCAGPGVFAGDCLRHQVSVGPGARAIISSQSALQIHPSDSVAPAAVYHDYRVEEDGELLCHWDPVIPFADARLFQRIALHLSKNSRLYWADALMSGRVSRGEVWRSQSLDHELRLVLGDTLAYLERYRLVPSEQRLQRLWAAGAADYLGTTIVRHEGASSTWVEDTQQRFGADVTAAINLVDPALGLAVGRFLGTSGPAWQRARSVCRDAVLESLFQPAASFRR